MRVLAHEHICMCAVCVCECIHSHACVCTGNMFVYVVYMFVRVPDCRCLITSLLLLSLLGYTYGWPLVQMRVLHEMIYSARKMGNPAIAIR